MSAGVRVRRSLGDTRRTMVEVQGAEGVWRVAGTVSADGDGWWAFPGFYGKGIADEVRGPFRRRGEAADAVAERFEVAR